MGERCNVMQALGGTVIVTNVLLIRDHKGIKKPINSKEKYIKILHFEQLLTIQNK